MENISINKVDVKTTKLGAPFLLIETSKGKMSVFDVDLFSQVKDSVGKEIEVEVISQGNYKNIVELGKTIGSAKSIGQEDTRKNVDAGNIVQRAVELTIAVIQNSKELTAAENVFNKNLEIITKAFIETKDKL